MHLQPFLSLASSRFLTPTPIPDPTLIQPLLFLALSRFPTTTLIPNPTSFDLHSFASKSIPDVLLRPVLLASQDGEQRWFGGQRDLDCSAPRVQWLRTPLRGKAEAQGSRLSKPEKKGMRPIGNSRGIAVRVGRLLSGSGKALDTFLCPLHESGLVEGGSM